MVIDAELISLVALFDDTDDTVISAVNDKMINRGASVLQELYYLYERESSPEIKLAIADRIQFLTNEFIFEELEEIALYTEGGGEFDLWQALYLVSKLLSPEITLSYFENRLFSMIEELNSEINEDKTPVEKVELFNHLFFHRFLFKLKGYPLNQESTAVLLSVLDSRKGNPITVTIIYFLLARSIGLDIYPTFFQGGMIPCFLQDDKVLFYMNMAGKGEIFLEDKLKESLKHEGFDINELILEVTGDDVLVVSYLEMLLVVYSSKGDDEKVELINRVLDMITDERFLDMNDDE